MGRRRERRLVGLDEAAACATVVRDRWPPRLHPGSFAAHAWNASLYPFGSSPREWLVRVPFDRNSRRREAVLDLAIALAPGTPLRWIAKIDLG